LRPQDLATLLELLKLHAGYSFISISSSQLGLCLGVTQQTASNRLTELERVGLIQRAHTGRGFKVRLTNRGIETVRSFYGELKGVFEKGEGHFQFVGTLFTGFGEGAYYVSHPGYQKQFRLRVGLRPFPGTLNLRLSSTSQQEQRRQLQFLDGVEVLGFKHGNRTFGPVKCFKAKLGTNHLAAALAIERTHYDDSVLEVISPVNLRKTLKLRDGDECEVRVFLN